MRKLAAILLCSMFVIWINCPGSRLPGPVNPQARLEDGKEYTIVYWEGELPKALDPHGLHKPTVEKLAADFSAANPGLLVDIRWLPWAEAETELKEALRDGTPPDVWADWQGLARMDHVLQVPADIWLNQELMVPGGKRVVSHAGGIWAWPRWLWPNGLLTLRDSIVISDAELEQLLYSRWDWIQLGEWLEAGDLLLDVNDWQGEFTIQALLAATGFGVGQWGGQELNQVLAAIDDLRRQGRIFASGEYRKITKGKNMVGGTGPAFMIWLQENMSEEELVLLPIPGISSASYYPVSSANLIQFRQVKYKGDDHTLAAAMLAEFMAIGQSREMAAHFWAVPAWDGIEWENINLPSWYYSVLTDVAQIGLPLYPIDRRGRELEKIFREEADAVLADFWAGKADIHDLALRLEELQ